LTPLGRWSRLENIEDVERKMKLEVVDREAMAGKLFSR
jgi:hypothetical protein